MRPPAPDPRYRKALALDGERRSAEAAVLLRKLLADRPDHVEALALLGTIEGQAGRFDTALALLQRASALRPTSGAILNNLGNVLGAMGRSEEALAAFDRSLALRPDHPRTLHNRARLLRRMGRETEAAEAVARVLALEPHNADAWVSHAGLLAERAQRSGDPAEVAATVAAYRSAREHGADPGVIDHALAALGAAPAPAVAPRAYVEALFDGYAPKFDEHLRDALEYRTPEMLVGAAMRAGAAAGCDIVDLGCGTGLCGPLLRPIARSLVGVDLSARMLEQAAARGCYDRTEHAEIVEHLRAHPGAYDLAIAADVLIYLGDLADFVAAARAALRAGGLLAISVEHHAGDGFVLLPSRRFAHGDAYLRALAQANGLEVASLEHAPLRRDRDGSIEGTLAVMRRPPGVAR